MKKTELFLRHHRHNNCMDKTAALGIFGILAALLLTGCVNQVPPITGTPSPFPSIFASPSPTATQNPTASATPIASPQNTVTPSFPPFGTPKATVVPPNGNAPFDKAFTLALGQTVTMEDSDVAFTFVNVTGDSRCPIGAQCIWAGMVSTQIRMQQGGAQSTVTASDRQTNGTTVQLNNQAYVVTLQYVAPYPSLNQQTDPADYKATFIVTKT